MIKAVGAGEAGMDIELYRKVIESSPVIVLLLMAALVVMWRKLDAKDTLLIALTREVLQAVAHNTTALTSLRDAIERGERHGPVPRHPAE